MDISLPSLQKTRGDFIRPASTSARWRHHSRWSAPSVAKELASISFALGVTSPGMRHEWRRLSGGEGDWTGSVGRASRAGSGENGPPQRRIGWRGVGEGETMTGIAVVLTCMWPFCTPSFPGFSADLLFLADPLDQRP